MTNQSDNIKQENTKKTNTTEEKNIATPQEKTFSEKEPLAKNQVDKEVITQDDINDTIKSTWETLRSGQKDVKNK